MTEQVPPDESLGIAAADALLGWSEWVHRRVESVHLMPGERGLRRVSLDCTPSSDPGLAYLDGGGSSAQIADADSVIQVPMALVKKEAMRDLDVIDFESRPMPVLGRQENGDFALAALHMLYRVSVEQVSEPLALTLERIVRGDGHVGSPAADRLLRLGECIDGSAFDQARIPEVVALWTRDLGANFILIGLLPANQAGKRQVLKWSTNWHI